MNNQTPNKTALNIKSLFSLSLVVICIPLLFRIMALWNERATLGFFDVRGFLSDIVVSSVVLTFIFFFIKWTFPWWVSLLWLELWLFICFANFEHILALGANIKFLYVKYLFDETFREGSVLVPGAVTLLIFLFIIVGMIGRHLLRKLKNASFRSYRIMLSSFGMGAVFFLLLQFVWDEQFLAAQWRQNNLILENISRAISKKSNKRSTVKKAPFPEPLPQERFLDHDYKGANVLLIILESISGEYIAPILQANGQEFTFIMPQLSRLAEKGITYTNFISQQRQTNRGEYALLCGEYPVLGTDQPKMTEYVYKGGKACLPEILKEAGYSTSYLQGSPLSFMLKDKFMKMIGYDTVLGTESFSGAALYGKWGIDDLSFFEQSYEKIKELNHAKRPWFVTLLTVGTHHPYNLFPENYISPTEYGQEPFFHSAAYADMAIGSLMKKLDESGILKNTLVLITSDESKGSFTSSDNSLEDTLSQAWGFLIVLTPDKIQKFSDTLAMQLDVPISILDAIGLRQDTSNFSGRSLFREYSNKRAGAFANTYNFSVGGVNPKGELYLCYEDYSSCVEDKTEQQKVFSTKTAQIDRITEERIKFLKNIVDQSKASLTPIQNQNVILTNPGILSLNSSRIIFGGQYFSVPPGTKMDIDLDFELMKTSSPAELTYWLYNYDHKIELTDIYKYFQNLHLRAGDRFQLRFSLTTPSRLLKLENRLTVDQPQGGKVQLKINSAKMHLGMGEKGQIPEEFILDVQKKKYIFSRKTSAEEHNRIGMELMNRQVYVDGEDCSLASGKGQVKCDLITRNRVEEALVHFREALAIDPSRIDAQRNYGSALRRKKDLE